MVKIAYIRRDGKVVCYSDKGITVGYIPPINMPIGVLGLVEDKSIKNGVDLVSILKILEQKGYPPEILAKIIASRDVGAFQEWLRKFPNFYDPGTLFIMYLLEKRGSDKILASAITAGFRDVSKKPSSYRGFFVEGRHSTGLVQQSGDEGTIADEKVLETLGLSLKTKFGDALRETKIEVPVLGYSANGRATVATVIEIKPIQSLDFLLT